MIDNDSLLARLQPGEIQALGDALSIVHMLEVFTTQVDQNASALAVGFQDRSADELAKEILQVQQTNRNLLALHEWAGNFKRDSLHAQES